MDSTLARRKAYRVSSVADVADKAALDDLLLEYYNVIVRRLASVGVPPNDTPQDLKASFWPNLHKFLPPTGGQILAHVASGPLGGCGALQQARPEANGHRLRRDIVDARIKATRDTGWKALLVNAIRGDIDMLRIYEALGFTLIGHDPERSDPIEVDLYFVYKKRELT